ncbi:MAG: acetyltransferase [Candidatus Peribacteraceae bacterium]|nr:acetyltransferase [Candidatus Peribacteraceae bacterium]
MASLPLILFGAGGHGKVVVDAAASSWRVLGFIDDVRTGEHGGYPILGNQKALEKLQKEGAYCLVSIGDCAARAKVQQMLEGMGFPMATVIHPSAAVSKSARIAPGSAILAQVSVGPDAVLGKGCIVNTGASVDHDCSVGDYTHIAPGARVAGGVKIGTQTFIGIGSCIREYCSIGSQVVIGAGAAVISDFGDGVTALGVPAVKRVAS